MTEVHPETNTKRPCVSLWGFFSGWILSLRNFGFPRSFWQYLVQPHEYLSTQKGRQESQERKVCGLRAREYLHIELTSSRANRVEIFFLFLTSAGLRPELNQVLGGDGRWEEGGGKTERQGRERSPEHSAAFSRKVAHTLLDFLTKRDL